MTTIYNVRSAILIFLSIFQSFNGIKTVNIKNAIRIPTPVLIKFLSTLKSIWCIKILLSLPLTIFPVLSPSIIIIPSNPTPNKKYKSGLPKQAPIAISKTPILTNVIFDTKSPIELPHVKMVKPSIVSDILNTFIQCVNVTTIMWTAFERQANDNKNATVKIISELNLFGMVLVLKYNKMAITSDKMSNQNEKLFVMSWLRIIGEAIN